MERTHGAGVNIWDTDPFRLPCGEGSTSSDWIGRRVGDRRFSFTGSSRGCPRAEPFTNGADALRLPITSSVEVSIPRERSRLLRVTFRGSSSPLCLACAWHGEVSGTLRFQNSLGRKEETRPSARGNASWPDPVELFGAVSVFAENGRLCLNHPGAEVRKHPAARR
jgi:hypothetical protein